MLLSACTAEQRDQGPTQPQTAPSGSSDPRIALYETNRYQVSQGGRYFAWYGCASCHGADAQGMLNLGDGQWRHGGAFDQLYAWVGHTDDGKRLTPEQRWQVTAYVRQLQQIKPELRRRQDNDGKGEPSATKWSGPL